MVDQACQEIRLQRTPGTFSYDCTQAIVGVPVEGSTRRSLAELRRRCARRGVRLELLRGCHPRTPVPASGGPSTHVTLLAGLPSSPRVSGTPRPSRAVPAHGRRNLALMGDVEKLEAARGKETDEMKAKLDAAQGEAGKLLQAAQEERRLRLLAESAVRGGELPKADSGSSRLCVLQ